MSTSGTFSYDPTLGELTLYAFNMAGVRGTELQQEHMTSARMASNLMQSSWSGKGVNLWAVDLQTINLVAGQATYPVPPETIAMLDAYASVTSGQSPTNRVVLPISRSEFASISQPKTQGPPTVYWFDRLLAPTITLWPVPDGTEPTFSYYRTRQIQDAVLANGASPEVPVYFLEAYALGLSARLALIWNPERAQGLKALADDAFDTAANQNVETENFYVTPMIGGYWRP